ncbi:SPOR domain-containing protein [Aestuariibacter sp. AA17]|uniref:SPOR domain-containing protein n=1 Tax=Fluctibacter corallii TaxID=2984329 RepID=A0ABT3AAK8_9ALTE|nr:SPOR domain-containing protein [Aestuariibacter sp. AA17]MCV2885635.1 SPOR domain-containing protein [Aestuariibacter sp. AA17]
MTSAFQNRLVGTIIIVALAVIFLPDILDGKKQTSRDLFVDLPQKPAVKPVMHTSEFPAEDVKSKAVREVEVVTSPVLDEPSEPNKSESANVAARQSQSFDADLEAQTVVETDETKLMETAGWVVQLGVFRHQKNVKELMTKLEGAGYRAFSQPVETAAGKLNKVFVGPDVDKQKLENAIPHLQELTNLKGRLTPFTVK